MLVDVAESLLHMLEGGRRPPRKQVEDKDATSVYDTLLTHSSAGVRIRAYEMLATSSETTKPIRSSDLQLLSRRLIYLHGDVDPANRGEITSITNAVVLRLRRGSAFDTKALAKPDITSEQHTEHQNRLKQHEIFLAWYISFLENELGPTCAFSRHISALKALQSLVESGLDPEIPMKGPPGSGQDLARWPLNKSLHYPNMLSALWHLLLDPFEEIRAATTAILRSLLDHVKLKDRAPWRLTPHDLGSRASADDALSKLSNEGERPESYPEDEIARLVENTNALAALTNRADHADGLGRLLWLQSFFAPRRSVVLYELLGRLERTLVLFNCKDPLPTKDFSLHGYLTGLKYIIKDIGFHSTSDSTMILKDTNVTVPPLLNMCKGVWDIVRNDLCVDSPEMSHNADVIGPFEGPKDSLSYFWRALRDSSLLMQAILLRLASSADEATTENGYVEHLRNIHTLCFEQLTALRHRGAFSTVAQTFALCCEKFAGVPSLRAEVKTWYQVRKIGSQIHMCNPIFLNIQLIACRMLSKYWKISPRS